MYLLSSLSYWKNKSTQQMKLQQDSSLLSVGASVDLSVFCQT